jgi:hypothetical protein
MLRIYSLLALCTLLSCVSVATQKDADAKKTAPTMLSLGESTVDELRVQTGDATDWKALDLREEGKLRFVIYFGNPACFCQVELFDPNGNKLETYQDVGQTPRRDLIVENAKPGRYYLHFSAKYEPDFSSYMVESLFYPMKKAAANKKDPE